MITYCGCGQTIEHTQTIEVCDNCWDCDVMVTFGLWVAGLSVRLRAIPYMAVKCDKCYETIADNEDVYIIDFSRSSVAEDKSWAEQRYVLCEKHYTMAHDYLIDFF